MDKTKWCDELRLYSLQKDVWFCFDGPIMNCFPKGAYVSRVRRVMIWSPYKDVWILLERKIRSRFPNGG